MTNLVAIRVYKGSPWVATAHSTRGGIDADLESDVTYKLTFLKASNLLTYLRAPIKLLAKDSLCISIGHDWAGNLLKLRADSA